LGIVIALIVVAAGFMVQYIIEKPDTASASIVAVPPQTASGMSDAEKEELEALKGQIALAASRAQAAEEAARQTQQLKLQATPIPVATPTPTPTPSFDVGSCKISLKDLVDPINDALEDWGGAYDDYFTELEAVYTIKAQIAGLQEYYANTTDASTRYEIAQVMNDLNDNLDDAEDDADDAKDDVDEEFDNVESERSQASDTIGECDDRLSQLTIMASETESCTSVNRLAKSILSESENLEDDYGEVLAELKADRDSLKEGIASAKESKMQFAGYPRIINVLDEYIGEFEDLQDDLDDLIDDIENDQDEAKDYKDEADNVQNDIEDIC
jgi:vacuolar-type H+-ATPase subunit I/STV1